MNSQEFYILLAVMCLGQCFLALMIVMTLSILSSYLAGERRRLIDKLGTVSVSSVFGSPYEWAGPNPPAPAKRIKPS